MKPRLTNRVMNGLHQLASVAEAGGAEEIMGINTETTELKGEDKRDWQDIEKAIAWIREMQNYRDIKRKD